MKKIYCISMFIILLSSVLSAKKLDTEEFMFKMNIPKGFEFETYEEGKWGGIYGEEEESETIVYALSYMDEADLKDIYKAGIELSEIDEYYWKLTGKGEYENGFEYWEEYKAETEEYTLYAILGKHMEEDISYLFFVLAPTESFYIYEKDYIKWLESCEGIE